MAVKNLKGNLNIDGAIKIEENVDIGGNIKKENGNDLTIESGGTKVIIPYVNSEDYVSCANRTYDSSETYYVFNDELGLEPAGEYTEFTTEMQLEWLGEELTASNFDDYKDLLYIYAGGGQHNELTFPQKSGTVATTDDVKANPTLDGTESALTGIEVNGVKFKAGGGQEVHLYQHIIHINYRNNLQTDRGLIVYIFTNNADLFDTYAKVFDYIKDHSRYIYGTSYYFDQAYGNTLENNSTHYPTTSTVFTSSSILTKWIKDDGTKTSLTMLATDVTVTDTMTQIL